MRVRLKSGSRGSMFAVLGPGGLAWLKRLLGISPAGGPMSRRSRVQIPPGAPCYLDPLPCMSVVSGGFGFRCCFCVPVVFWGFFWGVLLLNSYCVATERFEVVRARVGANLQVLG